MYRAGEVSVHRACCERAIIAIFSVGGGKQLSERMGRPLFSYSQVSRGKETNYYSEYLSGEKSATRGDR